jgi:hypothetical protein
MTASAHFSVDTRLTRLLGETYRSSEAALKELVDNAWDADARNVWITLPAPLTSEAIVVRDDGTGMTSGEMRGEYLNIASDKRTRMGDRTQRHNRKVKGRKGIGKFAGLTIAGQMQVSSVARGRKSTLVIDKRELVENGSDLEAVPLPFSEATATEGETGTTITLSRLDDRLNFPTAERLREVLIYEYGREDDFRVHVNGVALSVQDVPGRTTRLNATLPSAGAIDLHFTLSEGSKVPRSPGIILKVDGKAVGRPQLFGLDEDDEIPPKLARKVYGEIELSGVDEFVTADWGALIENSKVFQEVRAYVQTEVKKELKASHARDMSLQRARLEKQVQLRLQQLPEHRRRFAREALNRILMRFYGESEERIATIADVALDAIEHDAYWAVFERINDSSRGDMESLAAALDQFGLVELSTIGTQASRRIQFLDSLEQLARDPRTLEKDVHKAVERNLWILGRSYATMASNVSLRNVIATYCNEEFKGERAAKRPDLLLSQDYGDRYLLVEFKRPSHDITRDDVNQAEKYRDDLGPRLNSASPMDIMMIGKGRTPTINVNNLLGNISIHSYASVISSARREMDWLIRSLGNQAV